jgi:hypothetical protein
MSRVEGESILMEYISKMLIGESREQKIAQVTFYTSLSSLLYSHISFISLLFKTEYILILLLILEAMVYLYTKNFQLQVLSEIITLIIDKIIYDKDTKLLILNVLLGKRNLMGDVIRLFRGNLKEAVKLLRILIPSVMIILIISTATVEIIRLINPVNIYNLSLVGLSLSSVALLIFGENSSNKDNKTAIDSLLSTYLTMPSIPGHEKISKFARLLVFIMRFLPIPKVSLKPFDILHNRLYKCNNCMINQLVLVISDLNTSDIKVIYNFHGKKKIYDNIEDIKNNIPIILRCDKTTGLHEYEETREKTLAEKLNLFSDNFLAIRIYNKNEWAYIIIIPMKHSSGSKGKSNIGKVLLTWGIGSYELISKIRIVFDSYTTNELFTDKLEKIPLFDKDNSKNT